MKFYREAWISKNHVKAALTYIFTVSVTLSVRANSSWWNYIFGDELRKDNNNNFIVLTDLKRQVVPISQQFLPLVEGVEVGRFNASGLIQDMVVQNNLIYLVAGKFGMQIVDVSNPAAVIKLSQYNTPGFAKQLTINNGYVYVADGITGTVIIDVSNPISPAYAGGYCMGNLPDRLSVDLLAVHNNQAFIVNQPWGQMDIVNVTDPYQVFRGYLNVDRPLCVTTVVTKAYVGNERNSLFIVDISSPSNPQLLGSYDIGSYVNKIQVINDIAYIAAKSGLMILNVSSDSQPQLLGRFDTVNIALGLDVKESMVYLATDAAGLLLLNITNVTSPQLLGVFNTPGRAFDVSVVNSTAFVSDNSGIEIIDVRIPQLPTLISSLNSTAYTMQIINSLAYVLSTTGLQIIDVANLTNPMIVGSSSYASGDMSIQGDVCYTASSSGLRVLDISNKTNPVLLKGILSSSIPYPSGVSAVQGSVLAVADLSYGLQMIDVNRPLITQGVSSREDKIITDIFAIDDTLFYTSQGIGLSIFNTTTFSLGHSISRGFIGGDMKSVAVQGTTVYVMQDSADLTIVDASDPAALVSLGKLYQSGYNNAIKLVDNFLYAANDNGLYIYNVTNSSAPQLTVIFYTKSYALDLDIQNNIAYIANNNAGLLLIDVSNISNPQLLANFTDFLYSPFSAAVVGVHGTLAAVSTGSVITLVDVTDPRNPMRLGQFGSQVTHIQYSNDILYMAISPPNLIVGSGLEVVYADDGFNPQRLGRIFARRIGFQGGGSGSVDVQGNIAYVTNDVWGLQIMDVSDPTNLVILRNYDTPGIAVSMVASDQYVYVLESLGEIQIINTKAQSSFKTASTASQVTAYNGMVYVVDSNKNLYLLNVTDSKHPIEIARITLTSFALDMIANKNYLYIAQGLDGVEIFDISNASAPIFAERIMNNLRNAKSVKIEGSKLYVIDNYQEVVIFDIQTLYYLTGQFVVSEGERHVVTPLDVATTGFNGVSPSQLVMTAGNITHGEFELVSQPNIPMTSFTLEQVQKSQIVFVHDGSEFVPSFSLTLSDGITTKGPLTANILYQAINDPPLLENHFILINEGEAITVNTTYLNASDVETSSQELIFIITQQGHSQFERTSKPGVVATRFTQSEVMQGEIQFLHLSQNDNNDVTPYFLVSVSDGNTESEAIPAQIDYNAEPKLIHNELNIYRGQSLMITSNELQANDRDDAAESLTFIISNIQHGTFSQTTFKQSAIGQGIIQFQHDNSEQAPSYEISLKDKRMQTANQTVRVTFSNKNPILAFDTLGISLTATGGAVGLGLVGMGIFAYRNYARNKNSRKIDIYAAAVYEILKPVGAANFNSAEGQRFVQGLQALKIELFKQGIDVDKMGNWELNQLAEQTMLALQQEITVDTNWRGESKIDGHDIQRYAARLALAIQKIRAGVYDPSLSSAL